MEEAVRMLMAPAPPSVEAAHFAALKARGEGPGLCVQDAGAGRGKGLFTDRVFEEGEEVLRESPLLASQDARNRTDALLCGRCMCFLGSVKLQLARRVFRAEDDDDGDDAAMQTALAELPRGDGDDAAVPLPPVVACPGGCVEEAFCSVACAAAAWRTHHAVLCLGQSGRDGGGPLAAFVGHADDTNDVFHLAAATLVMVATEADRLAGRGTPAPPTKMPSNDWDLPAPAIAALFCGPTPPPSPPLPTADALAAAWRPLSVAWRSPWWTCVSIPPDAPNAAEFRDSLRSLAADSLSLLCRAAPDGAAHWPALFSLEVYGTIVGMFELNNLGIVVPSPVGAYTTAVLGPDAAVALEDDAPTAEVVQLAAGGHNTDLAPGVRAAAARAACAVRRMLGDRPWAPHGEGTAFYALQSCANHSCRPTAVAFKSENDRDGAAVLVATRRISAGEEVTISYVDEDEPIADRRAALADYGFVCDCEKCVEEGGA